MKYIDRKDQSRVYKLLLFDFGRVVTIFRTSSSKYGLTDERQRKLVS